MIPFFFYYIFAATEGTYVGTYTIACAGSSLPKDQQKEIKEIKETKETKEIKETKETTGGPPGMNEEEQVDEFGAKLVSTSASSMSTCSCKACLSGDASEDTSNLMALSIDVGTAQDEDDQPVVFHSTSPPNYGHIIKNAKMQPAGLDKIVIATKEMKLISIEYQVKKNKNINGGVNEPLVAGDEIIVKATCDMSSTTEIEEGTTMSIVFNNQQSIQLNKESEHDIDSSTGFVRHTYIGTYIVQKGDDVEVLQATEYQTETAMDESGNVLQQRTLPAADSAQDSTKDSDKDSDKDAANYQPSFTICIDTEAEARNAAKAKADADAAAAAAAAAAAEAKRIADEKAAAEAAAAEAKRIADEEAALAAAKNAEEAKQLQKEQELAEIARLAALAKLAEEEALRAEEEAKRLAAEKAQRLADEKARLAAEEAQRLADEEAQRLADEEAKRLAAEEAEIVKIGLARAAAETEAETKARKIQVNLLLKEMLLGKFTFTNTLDLFVQLFFISFI